MLADHEFVPIEQIGIGNLDIPKNGLPVAPVEKNLLLDKCRLVLFVGLLPNLLLSVQCSI